MAKAQNIIEIKFQAKDADKLKKAIKSLDKATKSLVNAQAKLVNQNNSSRNSLTKMLKSLRKTDMSFKKLGISSQTITKAYKGNRVAIERLRIAHDRHQESLKKTRIAEKKLHNQNKKLNKGLLSTRHSARQTGGAFSVLRSKMLLFQFAMALGVRQLINFTKQSAKVESMERAFKTLSGGSKDASIAIEQLQKATNNTMSEFDLFQQANNAMVLGVADNSEEMAEMFDIAQRLGRALGRDTASSVESLVTGIGRQSRLMLDNIGIIVKAEEAYESYARANNTTADALTDSQKKQAFLEATMESARAKVKSLGDETLTSQDSLDSFSASMSNLASAIGDNLGIFSKLGGIFAKYANDVANTIKDVDRYTEIQNKLNFETSHQIDLANLNTKSAERLMEQSKKRVTALLAELDALDLIDESNKKRTESEKKLAEAVRIQGVAEDFNKAMSAGRFSIDKQKFIFDINYKEGIQGVTNAIELQADKVEELTIKQNENFHSLKFLDAEQKFAVDSVRQLSSAFGQATINGQNMGDAVVSSLKAIASELIAQAGTYALLNMFTGGAFGAGTSFFKFITGHTGGLIKDNGDIQRFATGGMVQGQDNVPIMAQAGEFIIRKAVVEQVGVDTLARLNSGEGGAGNTINVNISGGVVDESYVNNELIPALNKASGLGNRINA